MKNTILSLIALFSLCTCGFAQNWTKETQKDFRKSKEVAVIVDFSKSTIIGADAADFPVYYANKYKTDKEYPVLILKNLQKYFITTFCKVHELPIIDEAEAKYVIHYEFKDVIDTGGAIGKFYVMEGTNKSAECTFIMKRGKWNDFETLMRENIKKYINGDYNTYQTKDPYIRCKLYDYDAEQ